MQKVNEKKWAEKWEKEGIYSPDIKKAKNPFYNLWMFPYPSAEGLHAGHAFASTGSDIFGRFMRMNGKEVFQPIGYDSFGIHSENYAIKINQAPSEVVKRTTKNYEEQMRALGHGYDWHKTVTTSSPDYYKWTQWLFLQMWEAGLAYKKKASVNFCPSCKTVLADEQVMTPKQAGREAKNAKGEVVEDTGNLSVCERCGTIVEKRDLDQWFFKITDYAERLLSGLTKIDWSERVKKAQENWIGKSEGFLIKFKVLDSKEVIEVFTTRPETLNSATFIAIASKIAIAGGEKENFKQKWGKFTGKYAANPLNNEKIPVWETNYVEASYGTGAIMGVPAYDERDMEFAKEYHIDIVKRKFTKEILGTKTVNYHLRDWLVSRQRYWGAPIPMISCPKCGWVPVPEKDLPVVLPNIEDYKPEGSGKGPLANHKEFYEVHCPDCSGAAIRETDVMDTFVDSSWYFLRYPSIGFDSQAFDPEITKKWLPVDLYFGGAEHSVLHLMYARFVTMVLKDRGKIDFEEPFPRFFAHGLMIKDGAKMSKSRGNVVNPDEYVQKYGADTLRLYLMFMGPMDGYPDFRDTGIEGMQRFTKRIKSLFDSEKKPTKEDLMAVCRKTHETIKRVTEDISVFKFNTAISALMGLVNEIGQKGADKRILKSLVALLAPFAPYLAEELWQEVLKQKGSVHLSLWPKYDSKYLEMDQTTIIVQVNGKLRSQLTVDVQDSKTQAIIEKMARKDPKVAKWLEDKDLVKTIFVPGKLINFVI